MEERSWVTPFVRLELPRLAGRQHTHDAVPSIVSKLRKRLDAVDDEVTILCFSLVARRVDMGPFAVDSDDVFGSSDALGRRPGFCFRWRLEAR